MHKLINHTLIKAHITLQQPTKQVWHHGGLGLSIAPALTLTSQELCVQFVQEVAHKLVSILLLIAPEKKTWVDLLY